MSRLETEVITIRVTEEYKNLLLNFALRSGYLNKHDEPNVSVAVKALLSIAIDDGDGQEIARRAYMNARADLLQRVQLLVAEKYSEIAEEIE